MNAGSVQLAMHWPTEDIPGSFDQSGLSVASGKQPCSLKSGAASRQGHRIVKGTSTAGSHRLLRIAYTSIPAQPGSRDQMRVRHATKP